MAGAVTEATASQGTMVRDIHAVMAAVDGTERMVSFNYAAAT